MSSFLCVGCGHANVVGARFCAQCGSSLAPRCSSCGVELPFEARFCSACGVAVEAEPVGSDGALKVVSVVFSDLVGSTALQEALDTESVRRVMGRFYEAMRAVVEQHDGAIQKFIGDAVVVVFGAPVVREDDALRAVRCAVAMVVALERLNDELEPAFGVRLRIRTGVNTGELVVHDEGIFVGDTMNTAARFEQAAGAGEVLIGEATRRLVRHQARLEEIEPLSLKGKSERVRAWRVLSVDSGPAARLEAPLVGRAVELGRLQVVLKEAVAAGCCRLVSVIGSPGLGKSRLAQEFAAAVRAEATVVTGHCEPSGEGITFLPVADVLRSAAGIAEGDATEAVVEKLAALLPADADRDRIVARAAALLGAGESASPEETFWSVRRLLESVARSRPLVVVLDDVHWGEPLFLDLIEHLVEWVRDAPLLLVALARPELRETREALTAAGRRATDVIELMPLDSSESRALVDGLLGQAELPLSLLERILETTDGNPLFLGELLRMLVDEGALVQAGEAWVAAGGADAVQVPPTIQALLTARIERLGPHERTVVERAAVIGKQFYRGAVAELVAPPVRSGIDGHLETLRRKDMVEPEGTYWIDEPVYRFHHVLIRDAAYHLLLKEARTELHEKFADWLAAKAGELVGEHEEVIAYHLEQAFAYRRALGPLDERARAIGNRAAELLWSAGRRALSREDLAAAANLLQRAYECGAEDSVLWDLGEALLSAGDTARSAAVVEKLSGPRKVVLETQLAVLTGTGAELARVIAATSELAAADDGVGAAKGHHVTAQVQAQLGQVADVEASLSQALVTARKAGDRRRITAVLAAAPRAALWGPSPVVRASGRCLDVVRILRMTPGNRHVEAIALRCQAVLEGMRGRAEAARDILAAGRTTLEELGLTLELHELAVHAGIVELLDGHPEAAEALLRSARDGFAALGVSVSAAQAAALLARALVEKGRDEEASAETEYAEQHAGGDLKTTITWCGVRAEALARRGALDDAVLLARRAVALAEPTDALADKADANMALANVLAAAGRGDGARAVAAEAQRLYKEKDHVVGATRAERLAGARTEIAASSQPSDQGAFDPAVAEVLRRFDAAWRAHDREELLRIYPPGEAVTDHRRLGWGRLRGEKWADAVQSVLDMWGDVRIEIAEVMACADGVIAARMKWLGQSSETRGEIEIDLGTVTVIRDGRMVSIDYYEPDDREAMLARFEELTGGAVLLGGRPPERYYAEFVRRYDARNFEGCTQLVTEDFEIRDHRSIGWETLRGREQFKAMLDSGPAAAPDIRMEILEVLACDDDVIALRVQYRGHIVEGGGEMTYPVGYVTRISDGQSIGLDQYDPDDRQAMLARFEELTGAGPRLGDRFPERWWARFATLFGEHDRAGLAEMWSEDMVLVDHRAVGWEEEHGLDAMLDLADSAWAMSPDIRAVINKVIACDDHVSAILLTYAGSAAEGGGAIEIPIGYVSVFASGRAIRGEQFDPSDREAMLARYAELGGTRSVLGDRPPERWYARRIDAWNRRDRAALAALYSPEIELVDHRKVGWELTKGREALVELAASSWELMSADQRLAVDEVLACDEQVFALRALYRGTGEEGAEFEIGIGQVGVVVDGRMTRGDQYDADDRQAMIAHYAELGGGLAKLGDTNPERWWYEYAQHYAARDRDGVVAMHADGIFVDHRKIGWESGSTVDDAMAIIDGAWAATSDMRIEVDEVLASDERACALRIAWRGTEASYGGTWEIPMGVLTVIEDGRSTHYEMFDPDDRAAILARFAELAGRPSPLGDSPVEQLALQVNRSFNEHDFERHLLQHAEDFVLVDHRSMGWGEVRGREALGGLVRSALAVSDDVRFDIEELIACDDKRVIALRGAWRSDSSRKAGPWEIPVGYVTVIEEGLVASHDFFEYDDTDAMRTRFAELSRGSRPRGTRSDDAFNRRDLEAMAATYADDIVLIDHRNLGWEQFEGREAVLEQAASLWRHMSEDIQVVSREVIAFDGRAFARIASYRGTARDGGDELDLALGQVGVMSGDQIKRLEWFDPDDRWAMTARYAALGGGLSALGDRPPERVYAEFLRRWAAGDLERILELCAEDYAHVDHRQLGWEPVETRNGFRQFAESVISATCGFHCHVEEVVACDERIMAVRTTWRGHSTETASELEFKFGYVAVVEHGLVVRQDYYDYDDIDAMLDRYAELGGQRQVLGDRPPERFWAEFIERFAAHDVEGVLALDSDDWTQVDHRKIGWGESRGRTTHEELMRSAFAASPDMRLDIGEMIACDDRVSAFIGAWSGTGVDGGGEMSVPVGVVAVIENGTLEREELYEPEQRQEMIARYVELGGGAGPLGDLFSERLFAQYAERYAARDLDGLLEQVSEDWVLIDHRVVGWEELRVEEYAAQMQAVWDSVSVIWIEVDEVLAADDRVLAAIYTYRGIAAAEGGGGPFEYQVGYVGVNDGRRSIAGEFFDPDDRPGMLARYAELAAPGEPEPPPLSAMRQYARYWDAADADGASAMFAEDATILDHRQMGGEPIVGREAHHAFVSGAFELSPDNEMRIDEVIACDEQVIAVLTTFAGTSSALEGGRAEVPLAQVRVYEGGVFVSSEMFEPDARQAVIARYAELGGGTSRLGDRPPEQQVREYARRFAAREIDGLLQLHDERWTLTDHRQLGWEEVQGREQMAEVLRSGFELSTDMRLEVDEVLACDERVIAMRVTWRGTAVDGGGQLDLPMGLVIVVEDGRAVSHDQYDHDDSDAMLARFAELTTPVGPELVLRRYLQALETRDVDAMRAMVDPEIAIADHRAIAGPPGHGPDAAMELVQSALGVTSELRFEIEEIIAQDDHAIACNGTWIGSAAEGEGKVTLPMALLMSVTDGRIAALELYEPDAEEAIRARFGELSLAALRPYHRFDRLYNERRLDELPSLYTDDYVMVDRRSMAWEEIHGGEALMETCRSFLDQAPDLISRCEPIVPDDGGEIVLLRNTFSGHGFTAGGATTGEAELVFIEIAWIRDDRLMSRTELFDEADEAAARTRYQELRAAQASTPGAQACAQFDRLFTAKQFDDLAALYTEDFVIVDHRSLGWEERHGQQAMVDQCRSTYSPAPDQRSRCEPLVDDGGDVVAYRDTFSSEGHEGVGPWELVLDLVIVLRDGRVARIESFDAGDEHAWRARYEQLRAEHPGVKELVERYLDAYQRRDWEALAGLWADGAVLEDHRQAGLGTLDGVDVIVRTIRGLVDLSPDARAHAREFLQLADGVALYRHEVDGHDATGGAIEVSMLIVVKAIGGRIARAEMFSIEDASAARTRFAQLASTGGIRA